MPSGNLPIRGSIKLVIKKMKHTRKQLLKLQSSRLRKLKYGFRSDCSEKSQVQKKVILSRNLFHDSGQLLPKPATRVFYKKAVYKNFAIFLGKHLCWSLFSIKLQTFRDPNTGVVNIAKFLRTSIFKNICKRLFLNL